jgi:hypothetical protein
MHEGEGRNEYDRGGGNDEWYSEGMMRWAGKWGKLIVA